MVLLTWAVASFASVEVENGGDCLDQESIDLELRDALDDVVVDRFVTHVVVRAEDAIVELSVTDREETLWSRELPFAREDCPYLAGVIARSVERGLATLPAWRLSASGRRVTHELGFQISGLTSRGGPAWGTLGGAWWSRFGRYAGWQVVADIGLSDRSPVSAGTIRFIGGSVTTGPALHVPVGGHLLRGAFRMGMGPAWFRASNFDRENYAGWWRRPSAVVDGGWSFPGALSVFGRADVTLDPVRFDVAELGELVSYTEPWLRWGLVVEFSGPLRVQ